VARKAGRIKVRGGGVVSGWWVVVWGGVPRLDKDEVIVDLPAFKAAGRDDRVTGGMAQAEWGKGMATKKGRGRLRAVQRDLYAALRSLPKVRMPATL